MPDYLKEELEGVLLQDYSLANEADWRCSPENEGDILMSAVEYKEFDENAGYGQLVYDLSTAQSVRRALGLRDIVLYGWTSSKAGHSLSMNLFASWWVSYRFP
jgi:hypothetical protein